MIHSGTASLLLSFATLLYHPFIFSLLSSSFFSPSSQQTHLNLLFLILRFLSYQCFNYVPNLSPVTLRLFCLQTVLALIPNRIRI